jgi:4-amino-4-deoxy-L-arabinose transferase-like glycosyltransferase
MLRRIDVAVMALLILPWALFTIGVNWIADYVFGHGWLDDWFYFGYFLELRQRMQRFPGTYYGSRLSWVLPGHLAYKFLPPQIAAYVLHFGVYYVAILSLYITLKHLVGRRAALIAAMLMGGYCFFLWAAGWDYVDGAGLMYFLMTTLALTLASEGKYQKTWLALAGVFCGAMIYSQLFLVVFTPSILLYYFVVNRSWRGSSLVLAALSFTSGFLVISLIFGLVNYKLGGDFLFYAPSVREAIDLSRKANPWSRPFHVWWRQATWLVMPALIFFTSLVSLWNFRRQRTSHSTFLLQIYYLSCALVLMLFEVKGMPVLQYLYYASFLMPGLFLAIGGQIGPRIDRLNFGFFLFVVCEATVIPLSAYRISPGSRLVFWLNTHLIPVVLSMTLVGIVLFWLREHPAKTLALCSLVCIAIGLVNTAGENFRVIDPDAAHYGWTVMAQSLQVIRSIEPSGNILFWYQADEPMGNFYRAVASTYLWGYTVVNERFPSLNRADNMQTPSLTNQIVILSNDAAAFQKADVALQQIGFRARLVTERRIQNGPIGWNMIFVALEAAPSYGSRSKPGISRNARLRISLEDMLFSSSDFMRTRME